MFSKKEASVLTGVKLQQLDYWARDQIGIVPQSINGKYSNVYYTSQQISELALAFNLKTSDYTNTLIKNFLEVWRSVGQPVNNYIVKRYDVNPVEDYKSNILGNDEEGYFYFFVCGEKVIEFMARASGGAGGKTISNFITYLNIMNLKQVLKHNAEKNGIDGERIAA